MISPARWRAAPVGGGQEVGPRAPLDPVRGEHPLRRAGLDHRGHGDERVAGVALDELRLVGGLDAVVELVAHAHPQLVHERVHVEPLEREGREQAVQDLGVVEVGEDGGVDARVLHLDGHRPAVRQHRPVDLPDARRGHRFRLPVAGRCARGRRPAPAGRPSAARLGAIGGASACSVASARWASSGSPSRMKPSSCPIFISAPFIWPSSRAASSAVRMTKRASSSARRSSDAPARRTWWAVQSAPRRALRRHTRADRETRARRWGSVATVRWRGRHRGGGRRDGCRTEGQPPAVHHVVVVLPEGTGAVAGAAPSAGARRRATGSAASRSSGNGSPVTSHVQ